MFIAGAAVIGKHHKKSNESCQDVICYKHFRDGGIAVLADGAGSYRDSGLIAEIIVKEMTDWLEKEFEALSGSDTLQDKVYEKCMELVNKADIKRYTGACTLLAVAVRNDKIVGFHVGDGMIIGYREGIPFVLSFPENGETLNETFLVSSKTPKEHFRAFAGDYVHGDRYMLVSDGAMEGIYERKNREFAPATGKIFSWCNSELSESEVSEDMAETLVDIFSSRTVDDMSMILMAPDC